MDILIRNLLAFVLIWLFLYPVGSYIILKVLRRLTVKDFLRGLLLSPGISLGIIFLINLIISNGLASFKVFLVIYFSLYVYSIFSIYKYIKNNNKNFIFKLKQNIKLFFYINKKNKILFLFLFFTILLAFIYLTKLPHRFLGGADQSSYTSLMYDFYERRGIGYNSDLISKLYKKVNPYSFIPISYKLINKQTGEIAPGWPAGFSLMAAPIRRILVFMLGPIDSIFVSWQFIGFFSLFIFFMIGEELVNKWIGLLFMIFVAFNWLQLWFTRFPMNEIPLQFFVLSIIYSLLISINEKKNQYIIIGIILSSFVFPIKIEGLLIILPILFSIFIFNNNINRLYYCLMAVLLPIFVSVIYIFFHKGFLHYYLIPVIRGILFFKSIVQHLFNLNF